MIFGCIGCTRRRCAGLLCGPQRAKWTGHCRNKRKKPRNIKWRASGKFPSKMAKNSILRQFSGDRMSNNDLMAKAWFSFSSLHPQNRSKIIFSTFSRKQNLRVANKFRAKKLKNSASKKSKTLRPKKSKISPPKKFKISHKKLKI